MGYRIRIALTDSQYAPLEPKVQRTGVTVTKLVRRAIWTVYGDSGGNDATASLERSFGSREGRLADGEVYVNRIRPGMARHLSR